MLKYLKIKDNIEIIISIIYINVFLFYFNFITNEQVLILSSLLMLFTIFLSAVITNSLEILLQTDSSIELINTLKKSKIKHLRMLINTTLSIIFIILLILMYQYFQFIILFICTIAIIVEIILSLSIFNLSNNILQILIRTLIYTLLVAVLLAFSQVPNLIILHQSTVTINYVTFNKLIILTIPMIVLFLNMSITDFLDATSNKFLINYKQNIFEIAYICLAMSIIPAIIFELLPLLSILVVLMGYLIIIYFNKKKYRHNFEYQCISYITLLLLFVIIVL